MNVVIFASMLLLAVSTSGREIVIKKGTTLPICIYGNCPDQTTEEITSDSTNSYNPYDLYYPYYQYFQQQYPENQQVPQNQQSAQYHQYDPYQQYLQFQQYEQYQQYLAFLQYQQQYPEAAQQSYPGLSDYYPSQAPTTEGNEEK